MSDETNIATETATEPETQASELPEILRGVTPEARRDPRRPIRGMPLEIFGQTWLLAFGGIAPVLTEIRDQMYDDIIWKGSVDMPSIRKAAWILISFNYRLSDEEIWSLLMSANQGELADATASALLGDDDRRQTWTTWVLSAFHSNAIDPATVPPHLIPDVMTQLVRTGRALPERDYIQSVQAAGKRAGWQKIMDRQRSVNGHNDGMME